MEFRLIENTFPLECKLLTLGAKQFLNWLDAEGLQICQGAMPKQNSILLERYRTEFVENVVGKDCEKSRLVSKQK